MKTFLVHPIVNYTIRTIALFIFVIFVLSAQAQDQCMPVGWAAENGGTTGGGAIASITVNTLSALQTQANSTGAKVIYVSGVLGAGVGTRVVVSSDKTIFGLPGATLNGGFDVKNADNVIIRNMIIKGPGAVDVDGVDCMTIQNSTNVWIDHCDISDGQDGNLDIVNGSNYISVTWTKFHYSNASVEHQFCNLIGNSDSKTTDRGLLKVTMMFNYWTDGCVERMPRVRFGQVHVVNNLFDSPDGQYGVRAGIEADILVEGNAFVGVDTPIDLYQNNFTAVTERNNLFSATTGPKVGSGTSFIPPYSLSMITAATVSSKVKPCVGATLSSPSVCPCGIVLPVELISFDVKSFEENYFVSWKLVDTKNLNKIILEYSYDGKFFDQINEFDKDAISYTLSSKDSKLSNAGIVYLRMKFIENDGTTTYSQIKKLDKNFNVAIYPNPFINEVYITGTNNQRLVIVSLEGIILYQKSILEGVLDLSHLPKGTYIFMFIDDSKNEIKRTVLTKL